MSESNWKHKVQWSNRFIEIQQCIILLTIQLYCIWLYIFVCEYMLIFFYFCCYGNEIVYMFDWVLSLFFPQLGLLLHWCSYFRCCVLWKNLVQSQVGLFHSRVTFTMCSVRLKCKEVLAQSFKTGFTTHVGLKKTLYHNDPNILLRLVTFCYKS